MARFFWRFLADERGFVTSPEWAFVTTILVLGAITGTLAMQKKAERSAMEQPLPRLIQSSTVGR